VTGCFLNEKEEVAGTADEVNSGAEVSLLLKSTLILDAGCVATKIGPRHLLLSARCVAQHKEAFAKGKALPFKTANNAKEGTGTNAVLEESSGGSGRRDSGATDSGSSTSSSTDSGASDAGAPKTDGGSTSTDAGTRTDAGSGGSTTTSGPKEGSSRTATIYETIIHPSYESKCMGAGDPCAFGTIAAGDAADVALVVLDLDLEGVEVVPVDLDAVGQADPITVIASGCDIVGAEEGTGLFTKKTGAVPAKSVNHAGSPYLTEPAKSSSLGQAYVITAGPAWKKTEAKVCKSDFGAPVFRSGVAAVAGVTSNFTTFGPDSFSPVTVHHTRLDAAGRFKIGNWLESQGAQTLHSCSEMAGGCVKREYEGGVPSAPSGAQGSTTGGGSTTEPGDASSGDAIAPSPDGGEGEGADPPPSGPVTGQQEQLADQGPPEETYSGGEDEEYPDAAAARKKKKAEESGCSAAPGPMPAGEMGLVFGVGLAVMAIARRRRSS
jgi:hypothetical protein